MNRFLSIAFFSVLVCAVAGCSGSDGSQTLRRYKQGDTLVYQYQTFSGNEQTDHGTFTRTTDGTVINPSGVECIVWKFTSEGETTMSYVYQDEDGNSYRCGHDDDFIVDPANGLVLSLPADLYVGEEILNNTRVVSESGYSEVCSSNIVAEEDLEIAGTERHVYKTEIVCTETHEGEEAQYHYTNWIDPDVGTVRYEATFSEVIDGNTVMVRRLEELVSADLK